MARTILRDRSGELVRSVQLADRTGIIAASAPCPAGRRSDDLIDAGFSAVAGQVGAKVSSPSSASHERRLLHRVRRNLVVTAVAVALLAIGWVAGDTFGVDEHSSETPVIAAGTVPRPVPSAPAQPAPTTSDAPPPQPQAPSVAPVQIPVTTKGAQPTRRNSQPAATSLPNDDARTDKAETPVTEESRPGRRINERIQQLIDTWKRARIDLPGVANDRQDRQDRSVTPFGVFGR